VFSEVRDEVSRPGRQRPQQREVAITFITHAECQIPTPLIQAIRRHATLYGIFVLPSQPLMLDYLPQLSGHHVITPESMADPAELRRRGLAVVKDVVATASAPAHPPPTQASR
ncbi:MAG TPA: hypothetical protein VGG33_29445, partial [Polyangia bacterium]